MTLQTPDDSSHQGHGGQSQHHGQYLQGHHNQGHHHGGQGRSRDRESRSSRSPRPGSFKQNRSRDSRLNRNNSQSSSSSSNCSSAKENNHLGGNSSSNNNSHYNGGGSSNRQHSYKKAAINDLLAPSRNVPTRHSSFREGGRPKVEQRRSIKRRQGGGGGGGGHNDSSNNIDHAHSREMLLPQPAHLGRRRSSMPNVTDELLSVPHVDDSLRNGGLRRVRSFKTTSKGGVVNRGDSFKKKSAVSLRTAGSNVTGSQQKLHTQQSSGSGGSAAASAPVPTYYRVMMMGGAGVGKSLIAKQFMTSDYVGGAMGEESSGE